MGKSASVTTARDGYTVPLSQLIRSDANVRATHTQSRIDELAASIAAHGLIQPLAVVEQMKKGAATGTYEVVAGGRRLAALQLLAKTKRIDGDALIDCVVFESAQAVSVSLAENEGQEPMHPADQCEAFARLIAQGRDVSQVAAQFGVTVALVERRLRLANVAPAIVKQFRDGKASLEQMMALAVTADNAAQLAVWKAAKADWMREPARLRAALIEDRIPSSHPMVKLVGVDAYQKAGGVTESDLFGADGSVFILDAKLLKQLANNVMQQAARKVVGKRPCAWIDCDFEPASYRTTHDRVETIRAPLTGEQLAQRAEIQQQIEAAEKEADELEARCRDAAEGDEDELEAAVDAASERIDQLTEERDAITNGAGTIPDDVLPLAGAVVRLGSDGKATTSYPVTRADDRKAVEAVKRKAEKAREAVERTAKREAGIATAEPDTDAPRHSDALLRTLTGAKTLGLRVAFATQTDTAIRMLAHTLVARHFANRAFDYRGPALGIRIERAQIADDMRAAAPIAAEEIARLEAHWVQVIPGDEAERAHWFLQADFQQVLDVLAFVTALQIDVVQYAEKGGGAHWVAPSASVAPYAHAIQYDARAWFTPTAEHYFARVNKTLMLAGLTDAGVGAEDLAKVGKAKKADAAAAAEQLVAAGRWVPTLVRVG